jgi:transcription elongation factor/antiterminator RfaH
MKTWYALHTKPNSESQVAITLQQHGIETYLPEVEAPENRQPRKTRPFFPCYLFMKIDFQEIDLSLVKWTPGLRRVVAFDDRPTPVPEAMITFIRHQLGEIEAGGGWPTYQFRSGDAVRITIGPFQDMVAIFEGPTSSGKRVEVLLEILGRPSRVQIAAADLEKADAGAAEISNSKRPRRTRGQGRRIRDLRPN